MKKKKGNLLKRFFKSLSLPVHKTLRTVLSFVLTGILLLCMVSVIVLSSLFLPRTLPIFGILLSSVLCSFLTVPITLLLSPIIRERALKKESEKDELLTSQEKEILRLREENLEVLATSNDLKTRVKLLENLTFNMETYQDVFKLCFRDYSQSGTIKNKEVLEDEGFSTSLKHLISDPERNYDEIVSVMDYMVKYQRGVDLQNIRIAKINADTIVVSGIEPSYITRPSFEYKEFLSELRHVSLHRSGELKKVSVDYDANTLKKVRVQQNVYKAAFEDSFMNGKARIEDSEEIVKRAKNFISIILRPIYAHVEFDETPLANDSLPLLDYLHKELSEYKGEGATSVNIGHS